MEIDSIDKLFEELILTAEVVQGLSPTYGGFIVRDFTSKYDWFRFAYFSSDSSTIQYKNSEGKFHRRYGPAIVNKTHEYEMWYNNGKLHRENGPAVTHRYNQFWLYEGKLHRIGGPAVITLGGPKQFWIRGDRYSPKQYKWEMKRLEKIKSRKLDTQSK